MSEKFKILPGMETIHVSSKSLHLKDFSNNLASDLIISKSINSHMIAPEVWEISNRIFFSPLTELNFNNVSEFTNRNL